MMLPTVMRGLSEEKGSWKTIWTCRRYAFSCSKERPPMRCPSNRISPAVGASSFMIIRPVVVFPQPDSPTSPTVSPLPMSKLMSSTARTAAAGPRARKPRRTGKCLTRFLTWISGGGFVGISVFREEAAYGAAVGGLEQWHRPLLASGLGLVASRGERAPHRQVGGIGWPALDRGQALLGAPQLWQGVDEP